MSQIIKVVLSPLTIYITAYDSRNDYLEFPLSYKKQ